MPKDVSIPDPNAATIIGASISFVRFAAGPTGVNFNYLAQNGDLPFEGTASQLTEGGRRALQTVMTEIDNIMKTTRGYTP